jgi:hypothetical protein
MNKLFLILILTLFPVLPNQEYSFAQPLDLKKHIDETPSQSSIDHISVQKDEEKNQLTITREKEFDRSQLIKLNSLRSTDKKFFWKDNFGSWCKDFPMSGIGHVRVIADVDFYDVYGIQKSDFYNLPINITLIVRDKFIVNQKMGGIDPTRDKPLNKIVVKGNEIEVEFHHVKDRNVFYSREDLPEIYSLPPPVKKSKSFGASTLLWRHPPEELARKCSDRWWTRIDFTKSGSPIGVGFYLPSPDFFLRKGLPFIEIKDIFFENEEEFSLNDTNKEYLKVLAEYLKNNPSLIMRIQGNADVSGKDRGYAIAVGDRRAKSTKAYLTANGVNARRLHYISYGKEQPFCTESSEECRRTNNRVHFRFLR